MHRPPPWLEGLPPLDLVITLDDATSALYSAILVAQEGTASTFARPGRGDRAGMGCSSSSILQLGDGGTISIRPRLVGRGIEELDRIQVGGGAQAAGDRPDRRLLAAGQGPLRAGVL